MVVCVKHWPSTHRAYIKKRPQIPVDLTPIFFAPSSFTHQSETPSPEKKKLKIGSVSKPLVTQKRQEQLGKILSWESLIEFCHELHVTVVNPNDLTLLRSLLYTHKYYFHWKVLKTLSYFVLKEVSTYITKIFYAIHLHKKYTFPEFIFRGLQIFRKRGYS